MCAVLKDKARVGSIQCGANIRNPWLNWLILGGSQVIEAATCSPIRPTCWYVHQQNEMGLFKHILIHLTGCHTPPKSVIVSVNPDRLTAFGQDRVSMASDRQKAERAEKARIRALKKAACEPLIKKAIHAAARKTPPKAVASVEGLGANAAVSGAAHSRQSAGQQSAATS